MDCERFDKVSLELLYDELDELNAAAARRHLHHCTRCQGVWAKLRATRDLAETPLEDPPDDLFESILLAEEEAHKRLPLRERFGRTVSILAGYAMRPQLAMAALLVLMVGSSLVFVRSSPNENGQIGVTEVGAPAAETLDPASRQKMARAPTLEGEDEAREPSDAANRAVALAAPSAAEAAPARSAKSEEDSYRDAITAYQEGRYAEAERLFSEVAAGGGEKAAAAALHEAHSARNGSGCQRAVALYDQVSASFQGGTVADEAAWQAATCYQALGQTERARAHYRTLASRPAFAVRATQALASLDPASAIAQSSADSQSAEASGAAPASKAAASRAAASKPAAAAAPAAPASPPAKASPSAADGP